MTMVLGPVPKGFFGGKKVPRSLRRCFGRCYVIDQYPDCYDCATGGRTPNAPIRAGNHLLRFADGGWIYACFDHYMARHSGWFRTAPVGCTVVVDLATLQPYMAPALRNRSVEELISHLLIESAKGQARTLKPFVIVNWDEIVRVPEAMKRCVEQLATEGYFPTPPPAKCRFCGSHFEPATRCPTCGAPFL